MIINLKQVRGKIQKLLKALRQEGFLDLYPQQFYIRYQDGKFMFILKDVLTKSYLVFGFCALEFEDQPPITIEIQDIEQFAASLTNLAPNLTNCLVLFGNDPSKPNSWKIEGQTVDSANLDIPLQLEVKENVSSAEFQKFCTHFYDRDLVTNLSPELKQVFYRTTCNNQHQLFSCDGSRIMSFEFGRSTVKNGTSLFS